MAETGDGLVRQKSCRPLSRVIPLPDGATRRRADSASPWLVIIAFTPHGSVTVSFTIPLSRREHSSSIELLRIQEVADPISV